MQLTGVFSYPVKSFAAVALPRALLSCGGGLPHDRRFAVAFNNAAAAALHDEFVGGKWKTWKHCHTLKTRPPMARLAAKADAGELVLQSASGDEARAPLAEATKSPVVREFLRRVFDDDGAELLQLPNDEPLWDFPRCALSLLGEASVASLATMLNREISPMRFRPNLLFCGGEAWGELAWQPGAKLRAGGAVLQVGAPVPRCSATSVNLQTAARDGDMPAAMRRCCGHCNMGVFVEVVQAGEVCAGDSLILL